MLNTTRKNYKAKTNKKKSKLILHSTYIFYALIFTSTDRTVNIILSSINLITSSFPLNNAEQALTALSVIFTCHIDA